MKVPFSKPDGLICNDHEYQERVRNNFGNQKAMQTLGIEIVTLEPGYIELSIPYRIEFTQQHGFMHAGIITTALDSACGYAAYSLMDVGAEVLTVEFKTNLLSPAKGDAFLVCARVTKPGRTLTVCDAQAFALSGEAAPKLIASMTGTLMAVRDR